MGLETVTNGRISELVDTNPIASDKVNKGDDHIRNIKKVIKDTFSGINAENGVGDNLLSEPVTANSRELNILDGATLTTDKLNILDGATLDTDELNILDGATIDTDALNLLDDLKSGEGINNIFDTIYPTGSIYMSTASADPSTLFPNTSWTVFGEGKVLVGYDEDDSDFSAGATGGSKTHTLTVDEIPSHSHELLGGGFNETTGAEPGDNTDTNLGQTGTTGGGQAHNNLQPYVTVYMWTRD